MKVLLKSRQYYGTHEEEIVEEFDCTLEKIPQSDSKKDIIKINFENGFIQIEKDKITHERGNNKLIIEKDNTYEVDYETENGMIVLDLVGLSVTRHDNDTGLIASARYEIKMVGVDSYINEIEVYIK